VLLTSGSITAAVDRLEAHGLVERQAHSTDRRARVVHLTSEGRRFISRVFAEHERDMERAVAVLAPEERATLVRLLKKLGLEAERLGEGPEPKKADDDEPEDAPPFRTRGRER